MENNRATVFVVDDDADFRDSLELLAKSVDLNVQTYQSAIEFLDLYDPDQPGCLVLDVRMPGMSGLELQAELVNRKIDLPVIVVTAYGEVAMAVRAMQAGVMDFIQKPFSPQKLLELIYQAVEKDAERRRRKAATAEFDARFESLSPRERQVAELLADGKTTKVIASHLQISPKTVDNHRARVLQKLRVDNVFELIKRMARRSD